MKIFIILIITALLIACGSTQLIKQDSNSEIASINSDQSKRYKFAGTFGDEEPYVIRKAPLEYPRFARNNKIEGIVILQAEVLADGTVGRVAVTQSVMSDPCVISEAAINSVKKWKFSPAKKDGKPIVCWTTFSVVFELKHTSK